MLFDGRRVANIYCKFQGNNLKHVSIIDMLRQERKGIHMKWSIKTRKAAKREDKKKENRKTKNSKQLQI